MYEELVKELRNLAWIHKITQNVNTKEYRLVVQTAHAIEELSKMLDEEVEINTALECNMPVWIPVTERLPDENDDILVYGEWTGASGTKHREIWLTDLKGFLHQGYKPIAWMPLPQPPKDGET